MLYAFYHPTPPPILFKHSDKLGHIFAFWALAFSGRIAFVRLFRVFFWILMLVLAFLLEYLQGQCLPYRVFSFGDVYANILGVLMALIILELFLLQKLKPTAPPLNSS